ncbi:hypothetical protein R6Q57_025241 [Mikania cordata]
MADTPPLFSGDSCASPSPTADANRSLKKRRMIVYEDDVNQVPSSLFDTDDDEEVGSENLKPIGNVVRVSGVGRWKRHHFNGFEADGVCYQLEDTVLVVQSMNTKPSVAIMKDISTTHDGRITVTGQRFYRLEFAENEEGVKWESTESRELFYSFDKAEFPADLVMHKCLVHFIPSNKEIPRAKDQPGFIVRKVYDSKYKELTELVDTGYDDCKQHQINVLLEKTIAKIPQLASTDEASVAYQKSH